MLKLKVRPVGTVVGALGGALIGYVLARRAGMTLQDASTLINTIPYLLIIPEYATLGGLIGYSTDKTREIKK